MCKRRPESKGRPSVDRGEQSWEHVTTVRISGWRRLVLWMAGRLSLSSLYPLCHSGSGCAFHEMSSLLGLESDLDVGLTEMHNA